MVVGQGRERGGSSPLPTKTGIYYHHCLHKADRLFTVDFLKVISSRCVVVHNGNGKHETTQMDEEEADPDLQPLTTEEMLTLAKSTSDSNRSMSSTGERSAQTSRLPGSFSRSSRASSVASSNSSFSCTTSRTMGESRIGHVQARTWAGQV